MSIFDHFFSNSDQSPYVKIAEIITNNKADFVERIAESVENTRNFVEKNISDYLERGIDVENASKDQLLWFALINSLLEANYACELDIKEYLDELEWQLSQLKQLEHQENLIEFDLDEEGFIEKWCNKINQNWQPKGFCLINLDIDSDSYVLVPVETEQLKTLIPLVESVGQKINIF